MTQVTIPIRWRDVDNYGHVNNAVYLTYLEQTRFAHWRSLWGFGSPQLPPVSPPTLPPLPYSLQFAAMSRDN